MLLPLSRHFLLGLTETPTMSMVNESAEWLESADESQFVVVGDSAEKEDGKVDSANSEKERP